MEYGIIYILILGDMGDKNMGHNKLKINEQELIKTKSSIFGDEDLSWLYEDPVKSKYQQKLEEKGFKQYSNYGIESFDILQTDAKYLNDNNIEFFIGESYDMYGNKNSNGFSLYIRDNVYYKAIENLPGIKYESSEELHEAWSRNREKFKDIKTPKDLGIVIPSRVLERIEFLNLFDELDWMEKGEYIIAAKESEEKIENIEELYSLFCKYAKHCKKQSYGEEIKISVEGFREFLSNKEV